MGGNSYNHQPAEPEGLKNHRNWGKNIILIVVEAQGIVTTRFFLTIFFRVPYLNLHFVAVAVTVDGSENR